MRSNKLDSFSIDLMAFALMATISCQSFATSTEPHRHTRPHKQRRTFVSSDVERAPLSKRTRAVRIFDTAEGPVAQEIPVYSSKATAQQIGQDQYRRATSALTEQLSAMGELKAELEVTAPARVAALAETNARNEMWNHAYATRRNGCMIDGGRFDECGKVAEAFANGGHQAGEPGTYPLMPGIEIRALKDKLACLDEETLALSKNVPAGNDPESKRQRHVIDKSCIRIAQGSLINFTKAIPSIHRIEIVYQSDEPERLTLSSFLSNRINDTKKVQRVYITEDSDFETSIPGYRGDAK